MEVTQISSEPIANSRFRWITFNSAADLVDDGRDVVQGLSQA